MTLWCQELMLSLTCVTFFFVELERWAVTSCGADAKALWFSTSVIWVEAAL